MATCPQCNVENPADAAACGSCGSPLSKPSKKMWWIVGIGCCLLSVVAIPVVGIVAAIAIPSLLRARVAANEAAAIGDTRTVLSAEMAYSTENGGKYDTLACLGQPSSCLPNYAPNGPTFLDPQLASGALKSGYLRTFHAGRSTRMGGSRSSVMSFAYTAVPAQLGQTGMRAFCGDSTGRVCATPDGREPMVTDGQCPDDCLSL